MGERWRPVPGAPGCQVSNRGVVLGLSGEPLSHTVSKHGYHRVSAGGRSWAVHRLVLEVFVGPCPEGMETRHLDGDPHRNWWPENLAWGTHTENMQDRVRHGTHNHLKRTTCRRGGHLLVEPNLRPWTTAHGGRGCLACHRAAGLASNYRRRGVPFDRDAYADRMYAQLMAHRNDATL